MEHFVEIPPHTEWLIAKTDRLNHEKWLPLWMHQVDAARMMEYLFDNWLPDSVKKRLTKEISADQLKQLCLFLGAVHDIGKATAAFAGIISIQLPEIRERLQKKELPLRSPENVRQFRHGLAGQVILLKCGCPESVAAVVGAHHGKPASFSEPSSCEDAEDELELHKKNFFGVKGEPAWKAIWKESLEFSLVLAGVSSVELLPEISVAAQVILTGLLIVADWLASNTRYFPLIDTNTSGCVSMYPQRVKTAWTAIGLTEPWRPLCVDMDGKAFQSRFSFPPNAVQTAVLNAIQKSKRPGLMILEAQMGAGKTEAALAAGERLGGIYGSGGLFFGLPTQATANGIFPRLESWAAARAENDGAVHGIRLAHGMAEMNEAYRGLFHGTASTQDDEGGLLVHPWFNGRKQALLADFVIGTVDQLLLAALKQKHVMLRHLGLAGKVVIVDECHAYDAYMNQYLDRALRWLGEYHVPVILLSATLPAKRRVEMVEAYLQRDQVHQADKDWKTNSGYPLLTWTDENEVKQITVEMHSGERMVKIQRTDGKGAVSCLQQLLTEGGCAGVIVNTVRRAQEKAEELRSALPDWEVILFHSQFIAPDRAEKEKELLRRIGKTSTAKERDRLIVVGTQVLEQSLDIDFDLLVTDLCPMDLLLQRIGRLHRHVRTRPEKLKAAQCIVLGAETEELDGGSKAVYGAWLLMRTKALLPDALVLPQDIPALVQTTYDETYEICPEDEAWRRAKESFVLEQGKKRTHAAAYRVEGTGTGMKTIQGWLDADIGALDERTAEAGVRDGPASLEVLVMQRRADGNVHFLPWRCGGAAVPADHVPSEKECRQIAAQRLRLPWVFSKRISQAIEALEEQNRGMLSEWQQSGWLQGELVLLLDEQFTADLCGYTLWYDQQSGLHYVQQETGGGK